MNISSPTDMGIHPSEHSTNWTLQNQSLRFTLGELCPFQITFRGLTSSSAEMLFGPEHLTDFALGEFLKGDANALVVRAHPAPTPLPLLSRSASGLLRYAPVQYDRCFVGFDTSFPEYMKKFSSKSRKNLNRAIRDFADFCGGSIDFREYISRDQILEFYPIARTISERTYQERVVHQGLPSTSAFREQMSELAERGENRGYLLFYKAKPVAFAYCVGDADGLYYSYVGYDPDFAKWSPGNVLLLRILERLFDDRFRWLDFGESEDPYKVFFANRRVPCARVYYFRPALRWKVAILLHLLWMAAVTGVGQVLRYFRLHKKIKTLLRWIGFRSSQRGSDASRGLHTIA
jgi:hypothetical protein